MLLTRLLQFTLFGLGVSAQTIVLTGSKAASSESLGPDGLPTGSGASYISYTTTIEQPSSTAAASSSSASGSETGSKTGSRSSKSSSSSTDSSTEFTTTITTTELSTTVRSGSTSVFSSVLTTETVETVNATNTSSTSTSSTESVTLLEGSKGPVTLTVINGTQTLNTTATATSNATSTSSSATPTNTQPCNNYPEFCERSYGNITEVCAHNSMFIRPANAASNQELPVLDQLNDGIRMLQGQTHMVNGTLHFCHSSCDLLDAGPVEDYLKTVTGWIQAHPYDVVTILMTNGDYVNVGNFTGPIEASGLVNYAYIPPKIPMGIDDWPTLTSMILSGKRAVIFLDYQANQTQVPYILDEFSQIWETPFDPTDAAFPCTVQRPPNLAPQAAMSRMYMANHNLNTEISIAGTSLSVPSTVLLNVTNNITGYGSLGLMANSCTTQWQRPPNFLLVDYYNRDNGTVFEVAAQHNNVTYKRACCGLVQSAAFSLHQHSGGLAWAVLAASIVGSMAVL